jgi:prepilin-type N-terminal cleavage/methylation domain-containing protein
MNRILLNFRSQKGFTLIEIIVTIILAAIMGTIFIQFMSKSLTKSAEPLMLIQKAYSLNQIIEEITADYKDLLDSDTTPIETLKIYIENGNIDGNNPYYGQYTQQTDFITFDGSKNEIPDASGNNRILKAIITSDNQSITVLFTKKSN